ncbi:MAG: extracellular solute-binding protein [Candidatus Tectomicrobia bacterium]|nr:extracellular solute-binding protein [Candidatus Tectomicrobia bacterium]
MKKNAQLQDGNPKEGLSRREFVKTTAKAGVALATGAGLGLFGGKAPAIAETRTLHILEWSSFVKQADVERDRQAEEFGKQAGVKVTVEHINANDLPARATAAIEGGTGPDILQLLNNYPHLYAEGLENHDKLIAEVGGDNIYSFVREAIQVNGVYRGVPYFFGGGANVYRKDIFKKVGIERPPDTWAEYLEAGKKLKKLGMPVGQTLGHTFGDAPGFAYPLLWSFGGKEVDEKGKVAINSKETLQAVEFMKEFWVAACDEGGLAWDDSSNNRAFLAETISSTLNGASIYFVARRDPTYIATKFADKLDHFLIPKGPNGRYHTVGPFSDCITRYSKNKEVAQDYIRFIHKPENYEKFLVINNGYVNGPIPKWQEHRMWTEDPAITIYRELPKYGRSAGYAGPYNRQASEVWAKYIIVDLFAKAVQGESSKSAIEWAEKELKNVYERS